VQEDTNFTQAQLDSDLLALGPAGTHRHPGLESCLSACS
jgi:hypothetical protein